MTGPPSESNNGGNGRDLTVQAFETIYTGVVRQLFHGVWPLAVQPTLSLGKIMDMFYYCRRDLACEDGRLSDLAEARTPVPAATDRDGWAQRPLAVQATLTKLERDYKTFVRIRNSLRDEVDDLPGGHSFWGTARQLRFGLVVSRSLRFVGLTNDDMDPVFGALLSPTGGIVGPGAAKFLEDHLPLLVGEPIEYHAIAHDAGGFLYRHFRVGPGYTYRDSHEHPSDNPGEGHWSGGWFWLRFFAFGPRTAPPPPV